MSVQYIQFNDACFSARMPAVIDTASPFHIAVVIFMPVRQRSERLQIEVQYSIHDT
jgi:hypothetical protein